MITKLIQRIFRRSPRSKVTQSPAAGAPKRISKKAHRIDPQLLSKNAVKVTHTLQQAGYQAYIVGGADAVKNKTELDALISYLQVLGINLK